jgi:hypothetical protein
MKNLKDKRSETSKANGAKGGRPAKIDFSLVAKILLKGLQRLAQVDEVHVEATASLSGRRLVSRCRGICAGFDEVISQSRSEYLKKLDQLGAPNPVEVRDALRSSLDAVAREVRAALHVLSAKAEIALQDADEMSVDLGGDIRSQLEKLAQLETRSLDKIVEMIIGVVEESLDRFGIPLHT